MTPGVFLPLPGSPRIVKYGRHSVKPELCRTQLLHSPWYWNTAVTGLSYRSCVLHVSMAVAMMLPPTPSDDTRNPITWQMVVDMVSPWRAEVARPRGSCSPTGKPESSCLSHQQCSCSYQMLSIEGCLLKVFLQDSPVSLSLPVRFVPAGLGDRSFCPLEVLVLPCLSSHALLSVG